LAAASLAAPAAAGERSFFSKAGDALSGALGYPVATPVPTPKHTHALATGHLYLAPADAPPAPTAESTALDRYVYGRHKALEHLYKGVEPGVLKTEAVPATLDIPMDAPLPPTWDSADIKKWDEAKIDPGALKMMRTGTEVEAKKEAKRQRAIQGVPTPPPRDALQTRDATWSFLWRTVTSVKFAAMVYNWKSLATGIWREDAQVLLGFFSSLISEEAGVARASGEEGLYLVLRTLATYLRDDAKAHIGTEVVRAAIYAKIAALMVTIGTGTAVAVVARALMAGKTPYVAAMEGAEAGINAAQYVAAGPAAFAIASLSAKEERRWKLMKPIIAAAARSMPEVQAQLANMPSDALEDEEEAEEEEEEEYVPPPPAPGGERVLRIRK
jgi:hypothetical protein